MSSKKGWNSITTQSMLFPGKERLQNQSYRTWDPETDCLWSPQTVLCWGTKAGYTDVQTFTEWKIAIIWARRVIWRPEIHTSGYKRKPNSYRSFSFSRPKSSSILHLLGARCWNIFLSSSLVQKHVWNLSSSCI